MWFSRKQAVAVPPKSVASGAATVPEKVTTKSQGDAAESAARAYLIRAGLRWVESNYRTPGRGGGEIDLIMRTPDGTLGFVEVRQRSKTTHGGAGASISSTKQRRIIFAARHYLMRFSSLPPCRFDVVLVNGALSEGSQPPASIEWLPAAFDAS